MGAYGVALDTVLCDAILCSALVPAYFSHPVCVHAPH